uniref:sialate O-acetylesterase n=1 Tax=Phenylobacterium sp. TaxID=1871053 RepID=UPI003785166B
PSSWGPEVQFALDFRAAYPGETLYIVKEAHGGTPLAQDLEQWHYDWSPRSDSELFDRTTMIIAEAGAAAGGRRPDAVFWGQGEEDGQRAASASAYIDNLPALLAAMRAEWMADPAGHIGLFQIGRSGPYNDQVRNAQQLTDQWDANAASFDTASFPMQWDGVHYAAEGYRMIGAGFFDLFEAWRGGAVGQPGQSLNGGPTADTLMGGSGDDSIAGGAGLDYLRGGDGRDLMSGGDDFDDMHGNAGNDTLAGGPGDDWVVGGKDNDRLFGDEGADVVLGNLGEDVVDGGAGADVVRGGQGNDQVFGQAGDDWLSGDRGDDTVSGGSGADRFHTFAEAGIDRVTDFSRAEGDRVVLEPGASWRVEQVGADAVVFVGGAQLILAGVSVGALGGDWISA